MPAPAPSPGELLVLWDRDCGFCAWTLARFLRRDRAGRLRTAAIQGSHGDRLLAHLPRDARLASWHAVDEDGRVTSAGAALTEVLRRLPGGRVPAALTARLPGLTERGYAAVAGHRSALSRLLPARGKERARAVVAERQVAAA
jgi:predicted DCC family thiol-disulfide oxidoreductase YuxK